MFGSFSFGETLFQEELQDRKGRVIAAEEATMAGDRAYAGNEFATAVDKYREALALIPAGSGTLGFREEIKIRFAQAAVESARVLNRQGGRAEAITLLDEVLQPQIAEDYLPAQQYRAKLDSPITSNPALTPEHAQNVDEVRRLLYKGEGAYNLADYDQATAHFNSVLRIDPTNKAARRWLERVAAQISDYATAARDEHRATLLSQVDAAWQLDHEVVGSTPLLPLGGSRSPQEIGRRQLQNRIEDIVIESANFPDVTIEDALSYLSQLSRKADLNAPDGQGGVDFVLNLGSDRSAPEIQQILNKRFDLSLRNAPIRAHLDYITELTGTGYRVEPYSIVIYPLSVSTDDLYTVRYSVPPDFLTASPTSGGSSNPDPFGDGEASSKLAPRLGAKEFLVEQGVVFPEGGTANYNSGSNELMVKTSSAGHQLVQTLVDSLQLAEPFNVVIEAKIIRILQEDLDEISFDHLVTGFGSNDLFLQGGTVGSGRAIGDLAIEDQLTLGNPVTSGLRSGDTAFSQDGIQNLLESENTGTAATEFAAPGILSVIGTTDNHGFASLLRGFAQSEGTDQLQLQSVITKSGQAASTESVREFFRPTSYDPPEIPNTVGASVTDFNGNVLAGQLTFFATPSHPTDFQLEKVGASLEVQPVVGPNRQLTDLSINFKLREFLGFINFGSPITGGSQSFDTGLGILGNGGPIGEVTSNDILMPIFDQVGIQTNVTLQNGHTVMLGGLISESLEDVEDRVPILGNLPLVGGMFRSDGVQRTREAVYVFVTVKILDPAGQAPQL